MGSRPARIIAILVFVSLSGLAATADDWLRVRWVNDGDTIVLADGRRGRYLGINAPEIAHEQYGQKAEPLGYEALALNRRLVHRKRVRLELDAETHDAYDRLLAYVYVQGTQMVNVQMVVAGLAYFQPHWPNGRYDTQLLDAQRVAMQAKKGIWRRWQAHREPVIGNRRSRRFHVGSCPNSAKIHTRNRIQFDRPWKAFWEGYAPAKKCFN